MGRRKRRGATRRERRRTDAEARACYAVSDGSEPSQLGLVNGEVWTRGTIESLLVEDVDRF